MELAGEILEILVVVDFTYADKRECTGGILFCKAGGLQSLDLILEGILTFEEETGGLVALEAIFLFKEVPGSLAELLDATLEELSAEERTRLCSFLASFVDAETENLPPAVGLGKAGLLDAGNFAGGAPIPQIVK